MREDEAMTGGDLWAPASILHAIRGGAIHAALSAEARAGIDALSDDEAAAAVIDALTRPQPRDMSRGRRVIGAVLAAQYAQLFARLELPRRLCVYEPCVGASDPVIVAAEAHSGGTASYTAVNLNRKLRGELQGKVAHLASTVRVIDDNALRVREHLEADSVDVACFHHAINDALQTAVAEPRGMDTATLDWWPNERQMIEWLAEEHADHGLKTRGRPELMHIVTDAIELVRPGGWLLFDHWAWLGHRDQAWFPWELFGDLVPLARRWIEAASLPVAEVALPGVDPRWWMALRVDS